MADRSGLRAPVAALILAAYAALAGCATPVAKAPRTTVVLLPDEDGAVGAVSLSNAAGSMKLDEAFSASTAGGAVAPTPARALDREALGATYAGLLKAQPPKPKTFVLHFLLDKTVLTEASKALLAEVLQAVRERKPTEITVFGHTDAIGTKEGNLRLSAERAQVVADWLKKSDPTLERIEVQSFGDAEPAFRSGERAAEPRNRRAEIMIL